MQLQKPELAAGMATASGRAGERDTSADVVSSCYLIPVGQNLVKSAGVLGGFAGCWPCQ